jgi:hypothetical protein
VRWRVVVVLVGRWKGAGVACLCAKGRDINESDSIFRGFRHFAFFLSRAIAIYQSSNYDDNQLR